MNFLTTNRQKKNLLNEKDQTYLQHISKALEAENGETFNFGKLPLSWLTTDQLRTSAVYWSKYSRAQPVAWLTGATIAVLAAPLTYYIVMWNLFYPKNVFLELTAENMTRIGESIILLAAYVIAVIGGTLVVGHGLSCLMLIPKKNRIFDPDPMKRADHLGVKWTLQRYKLLPKNDLIWLNRMEKMGVVSRLKKDNYKLSGTLALIKSAEDEKAE